MKTSHLKEFVVLSQMGGFREAARHLYISQSALSKHIMALEEEVGCKLVNRENGATLTPEGLVFLDSAQAALRVLDSAVAHCRSIAETRSPETDPARIEVHMMYDEARRALARKCSAPYEFVLYELSRPLLSCFSSSRCDIMVTYDVSMHPSLVEEARELGLEYEPLGCDVCEVCMKATHPLADVELTREALRGQTFALLTANEFHYWKKHIRMLLGGGFDPSVKIVPIANLMEMEVLDLHDSVVLCIADMVEEYFGYRDDYVIKGLVDGEPLKLPTCLLYRPNTGNVNVEAALAALKSELSV